jgi:hypothetical protein
MFGSDRTMHDLTRQSMATVRGEGTEMREVGAILGVAVMLAVLGDAFAVMILPRRVKHIFLTRLFVLSAWSCWRAVACLIAPVRWRNAFLGVFGPLSLLALLAVWALGLIAAFTLLYWSLGTTLTGEGPSYLYFSATTFFTLGFGDLVPTGPAARMLTTMEAGLGYGFLAIIICYLPVLYQAFSRREITISLLDARAGSPPTAGELLRRLSAGHSLASVGPFLAEWERWAAELLESQLSFPALCYYRSQHENQSWLGALTMILDTSSLVIVGLDGPDSYQARLTFAMARHAAVDLALVFHRPPRPPQPDRLAEADLARLWTSLREAGLPVRDGPAPAKALAELRRLYEPFVNGLAEYFHFALPPFQPEKPPVDNWQTSAWTERSPGLAGLPTVSREGDSHFD